MASFIADGYIWYSTYMAQQGLSHAQQGAPSASEETTERVHETSKGLFSSIMNFFKYIGSLFTSCFSQKTVTRDDETPSGQKTDHVATKALGQEPEQLEPQFQQTGRPTHKVARSVDDYQLDPRNPTIQDLDDHESFVSALENPSATDPLPRSGQGADEAALAQACDNASDVVSFFSFDELPQEETMQAVSAGHQKEVVEEEESVERASVLEEMNPDDHGALMIDLRAMAPYTSGPKSNRIHCPNYLTYTLKFQGEERIETMMTIIEDEMVSYYTKELEKLRKSSDKSSQGIEALERDINFFKQTIRTMLPSKEFIETGYYDEAHKAFKFVLKKELKGNCEEVDFKGKTLFPKESLKLSAYSRSELTASPVFEGRVFKTGIVLNRGKLHGRVEMPLGLPNVEADARGFALYREKSTSWLGRDSSHKGIRLFYNQDGSTRRYKIEEDSLRRAFVGHIKWTEATPVKMDPEPSSEDA